MTGVILLLPHLINEKPKLREMRLSQGFSSCLYRTELECSYQSVKSESLGQVRTDLE